jgi:oligosaccharyltransferase complex subunit beta
MLLIQFTLFIFLLVSLPVVKGTPMTSSLPNHEPISEQKRTLVLLDDPLLKNTSSKYFDSLANSGHKLKFKKLAESSTIFVKTNGEFEFDNVIMFFAGVVAPTDKSITNLLEFIDAGGNVLIATSGNSKWVKDFAFENGIKIGNEPVKDRFPPSTGDVVAIPWPDKLEVLLGPTPSEKLMIRYVGTSTEPTNEASQLGAIVALKGTTTSFQAKSAISGSKLGLITSVEMRNNARVTVSGSISQFEDSFYSTNGLFNERLTKWTFAEASVLRVKYWSHGKIDGSGPERQVKHARHLESNLPRSHFPDPEWGPNAKIYRIRDEVEYRLGLEIQDFDGTWKPYQADDVQIEFAMLDPYQRRTFTHDNKGNYNARFMLPDQYGTFAFRVVYNRPGFSRLRVLDSVNVRPFRHDEYERFILSAYPYYAAVAVVMGGFLLFSVSFAMTSRPHKKTE